MTALTRSQEDYLEAVYRAASDGRRAQVGDVARRLGVKMPSVVKAVAGLKRQGLVTQEPYAPVALTEKGERVARRVFGLHQLLKSFLVKLGVSAAVSEKDACRMEHILSAETVNRIRDYMESEQDEK